MPTCGRWWWQRISFVRRSTSSGTGPAAITLSQQTFADGNLTEELRCVNKDQRTYYRSPPFGAHLKGAHQSPTLAGAKSGRRPGDCGAGTLMVVSNTLCPGSPEAVMPTARHRRLTVAGAVMQDSYMKSGTYPLAVPRDCLNEIRECAQETGSSMADAMRQSIEPGLPMPQKQLSPESSTRAGPPTEQKTHACWKVVNAEFGALEHHYAMRPYHTTGPAE